MVRGAVDCEKVVIRFGIEFHRCGKQRSQRMYHAVLVVSVVALAVRHATPIIHYVAKFTTGGNLPEGICVSRYGKLL